MLVCQVDPAPPSTPTPARGPVVSLPGSGLLCSDSTGSHGRRVPHHPRGPQPEPVGGAYAREGLCLRRQ